MADNEAQSTSSPSEDGLNPTHRRYLHEAGLHDEVARYIDFDKLDVAPDKDDSAEQHNAWVLTSLMYWGTRQPVDEQLLGEFQEDYAGWNEARFRLLNRDIRRALRLFLTTHGIYLGRWNGPINHMLELTLAVDDLPLWTKGALAETEGSFHPRSKAPRRRVEQGERKDPDEGNNQDDAGSTAFPPLPPLPPSNPTSVPETLELTFEGIDRQDRTTQTPVLTQKGSNATLIKEGTDPIERPQDPTHEPVRLAPRSDRMKPITDPSPYRHGRLSQAERLDQTIYPRSNSNPPSISPYRQIPPKDTPSEMLPATILTQFVKIWRKEMNYTGEAYDILDEKVRYFLNVCSNVGIKETQFHAAFTNILDKKALEYYSYHMQPNMTFAEMYWTLRNHFDTEVNREHYYTDWTTITFLSLRTKDPSKSKLETLEELLTKIRRCQRALGGSFMTEDQLISTTIRACRGVQELEIALYIPAHTFEQLSSQLRSSIITFESRNQHNLSAFQQAPKKEDDRARYFADRSYRRGYSRQRQGGSYRQRAPEKAATWKTRCFICGKADCRSYKHPEEERERSKREWRRGKEFRGEKGTFAAFLAEFEGDSEDDDCTSDESDGNWDEADVEAHFTEYDDQEAFLLQHDEEFKIAQGLLDKATYHRFATGYDRVNEEPDNLIVNQATMFVTERYSDHTYQGQMPDTGASTISTVGIGQARALMRECPSVRFDTAKARNNTVRFGDGPKVECLGTVTVTGPLGEITYHVIEGNTPFLFCLKDMDEKGIYFDNIANELVNSRTGARVEVTRKFGHGWFHTSIANDAASYFNEAELRRLHKRFGHPSVAKLEALLIRAGHETDRDALEAIRKMCHYCQTKGSAGKRFRFTLKREADFNYEVIVDVMYLDNKPVLHIVDAGTSFQAARFLRSISAKETWEKLKECWIDAYLGPPDIISHDAGTNFDSAEFRAEAKLAGITINQIPVEAHWSIGKVERYHGPLRRAYEIIRSETKKAETSQEACLQMAVKAINDTSGPDGLVPTLLVFGAYPRISKDSPPTASQQQRAAAAAKAMTEVRKLRAAKEVREALNTRNGQDTSATLPESLPLGSEVLVYREKEKWTGPFKVLAVTESNVTVELDNGPATFRSTTIKPYHRDSTRTIVVSTGSTEDPSVPQDDIEEYPERKKKRPRGRPRKVRDAEAFVTHKERAEYELALQLRKEGRIVTPGRPFEISDAAEIDALFDTGVLVAVHIDEVDKDNAQFFGSRIVREVKGKTTVPYEKSRLVVRGFQDHAKTAILTQAPTIQRASQHTLLALGPTLRRFGHEVMLRDISQAYTQSETQLNRRIYLRLPPELTEKYPEGIVLKVEKPLYGLAEAGLHWYATYSKHHRERLGMEPISSDPCLFLTQQDDEFGITAIQTDDTFNIGTEAFIRREDEELKKAGFKAKPQRVIKTGDSCDFNGSYIQFDEESFNCTQKGQADRLQLVDHTATDRQQQYIMQRARGAYLASICQPEASYGYSVAAQVRNPDEGDIAKLNKCIQWQLDNKQRGLRYQEIDLPTAKLFVFVDGSFANNKDLTSQIGYVIVLGNEEVGEDRTVIDQRTDESDHVFTVTGNLVHWSSTKCKRVTRSVLASEVYGMVGGFDLGYVIWHTLGAITQRLGITRPPLILCTDSYSLYQCLVQLGSTTEKRLMIDIMALRQSYETREIHEIRWIKGDDNPADAMTKASPNRALEGLVVEGRISIRLEGWVQRE
ncbi:Ribonuclease H [Fusarium albosuccineum]|uniref:Ribonuclease H n=1 Tax=Fusarium albosuccineum TaxID=1237068 RepID=A0A8H4PD39_9HYPO|nr:Ribonuclease H [Fusarium albosuccineum]